MPHSLTTVAVAFLVPLATAFAQGGTWTDRQTAPPTGACTGQLLAYDSVRQESVWFGWQGCRETWVWNGTTWTQRPTSIAPPARFCTGVFDSARGVVVAVFGDHSTGLQTWEWNGSAWSQVGTGPTPARHSFGMAFDAARGVTVLFGGNSGNSQNSYVDTWTWSGTAWTLVMQGGPMPRSSPGMAFDVQRQTVVLFGGEGQVGGQGAFFGDTWEWNGAQWSNHFGVTGPGPRRANHHLVHDAGRNRTLLHGGSWQQGIYSDTWEWNGSAWTQLLPQATFYGGSFGIVHDAARGVVVMLRAGSTSSIWEYVAGSSVPATFAPYGLGCTGPNGVPQLSNLAGSLPRIGTTLQLRLSNLPASPFNVPLGFVGFDATTWGSLPLPLPLAAFGFPGCEALLAPIRSDGLTNNSGVADWNVPLPMSSFALGVDLYFQGAVFVPGWNPGGFVFSNGGHAVVGSP